MRGYILPLAFLLAWTFVGTSCNQIESPTPLLSSSDISFIPLAIPDDVNPARLRVTGADPAVIDAYNEGMVQAMKDLRAFGHAHKHASNWKEAYEAGEAVIERWASEPQSHHVTQVVSHKMLNRLLHEQGRDGEAVAAIERHTSRLVDVGHPHLALVLDGIAQLSPVWTETQRAEAIGQAQATAETWLEKNPCQSCLGEGDHVQALTDAREFQIARIAAAVPEARLRLQALSTSL